MEFFKKNLRKLLGLSLVGISLFLVVFLFLNKSPRVNLIYPESNSVEVSSSSIDIIGYVSPKDASVFVNFILVDTKDGKFQYNTDLQEGVNNFSIRSTKGERRSLIELEVNRVLTEEELQKKEEEKIQWESSLAGQLCVKYPEWPKRDCEQVANNKISIGMRLEMLKEMLGEPDSTNPSNYGLGVKWQWCWHDYNPSCFYGGDDGIIESYN